jgi:hypothetical protein
LPEKGCPLDTTVRVLADKWQPIIWRCWQDRRYSEEIYLAAFHGG